MFDDILMKSFPLHKEGYSNQKEKPPTQCLTKILWGGGKEHFLNLIVFFYPFSNFTHFLDLSNATHIVR